MKIPTNLMHKPVIVCENYENIDGRNAYKSDAKGLSLGLPSGMTGEKWIFPLKCGATREKNGPANLKNCRCTGY